jgi:hypothetical protein
MASGRLEELLATPYATLTNIVPHDYAVGYLSKSGNTWGYTAASDPGETFTINGHARPVTTEVQFTNVNGTAYAMLLVAVKVGYLNNSSDRVVLTTVYGP